MSRIAQAVFQAGPEDSMTVTDVYAVDTTQVVNSYQDVAASKSSDLFGALKSINPADIKAVIRNVANGRLAIDPNALITRMMGGNQNLNSAFRTISSTAQAGFQIDSTMLSQVTGSVGGITTSLNANSLTDARGFANIINAMTGNKYTMTLVDKGATASLIAGVSIQANALGLPNVFSTIASVVNSKDILLMAARQIVPAAILKNQLSLLKDVAKTVIARQMVSYFRDFARSAISSLRKPVGVSYSEYPAYYREIDSMMTNTGAEYKTCTRNGVEIANAIVDHNNDFYNDLVMSSALNDVTTIDALSHYSSNASAAANLSVEKCTIGASALGIQSTTSQLESDYYYIGKIDVPTSKVTDITAPGEWVDSDTGISIK